MLTFEAPIEARSELKSKRVTVGVRKTELSGTDGKEQEDCSMWKLDGSKRR